ncbi:hypothetical protein ACFP2T_04915 [Plantactinospora solaniradicis]|uniref:Uncharacterized protein n=1 Tax=Plantactinospora solaniradicis TaxID=1723736 RepID=A0ABW1K2M1_9ACTN
MLSEAEARKIVGVDGAEKLIEVVEGAWQDHLDEGQRRGIRARAAVVWEYMIRRADDALVEGMEGVRRAELTGSAGYVLRERMLLRFKKHSRALLSRNYPTRIQVRLDRQGFLDGMPQLAHVTCGYVLDRVEASIEKVVLVRKVAGQVEWAIDLRELAAGVLAPVAPILPSLPGSGAAEIAALPSIARVAREEDGDVR